MYIFGQEGFVLPRKHFFGMQDYHKLNAQKYPNKYLEGHIGSDNNLVGMLILMHVTFWQCVHYEDVLWKSSHLFVEEYVPP